ncbi:LysE family translocator [Pendulispora rubella]|uniref:LysE family translocator n=1 Tax=Pendulispora rubella TaxID=2741070 RepID=A0ABZ2L1H1_9BACT
MLGSSLVLFAATLGVAAVSPGPTTMTVVARVLGRGYRGAPMLHLGILCGEVVWLSCAAMGAATLADRAQPVFMAIKYAGIAYLLYLAVKLWSTRREASDPEAEGKVVPGEGGRLVLAGLTLSLSNPKTMLFYLALLPSIVDLSHVTWLDLGTLLAVAMAIVTMVNVFWAALAGRARKFFRTPAAMRIVDRVSGVVMATAAAIIAIR